METTFSLLSAGNNEKKVHVRSTRAENLKKTGGERTVQVEIANKKNGRMSPPLPICHFERRKIIFVGNKKGDPWVSFCLNLQIGN